MRKNESTGKKSLIHVEGKHRRLGNGLLIQERNKYIQLQILHLKEIMI